MDPQPLCWIIAGPNGAGKTTFALDYLPEVAHCQQFINADCRFGRSLHNLFQCYAHKTHRTRCYLNSGDTPVAVFVQSGDSIEVLDTPIYHHLRNKADL